ncbi:MAG TPA: Mini-ribonuclease 3 [Clostridiales bacterium]|nr:Mini-ribonuclease 3 [Clostridiales bacterium]
MIGILCGREAMTPERAAQLAPLTLAYVGDSVFDLFVRTMLILKETGGAGLLHKESVKLVNARAQAAFAGRIKESLTERELNVFMRGRNAKSATTPKNMSVADYRHATAAEALIGYLYLSGQHERLKELLMLISV